ncbi:hypothetical protein HDV06_000384 [Boothiomyces sp. JEL0866]|nr:hypothetical protein HDV06_000384 [Boothiomyces sp. JEL0866]
MERIVVVLTQLCLYIIWLFDIGVLKVFSVLNPKITPLMINMLIGIVTAVYALTGIWEIAKLFYLDVSPQLLTTMNTIGSVAFSIMAVLYDNIQTAYVVCLIYTSKTKKGAKTSALLNDLMFTLVFISVCDWLTVGIYAYTIKIGSISPLYLPLCIFVEAYTDIHGLLMIIVFRKLKDFTFVDKPNINSKPKSNTVVPLVLKRFLWDKQAN